MAKLAHIGNPAAAHHKRRLFSGDKFSFPAILHRRRLQRGWSQEALAGQLEVSKMTIHRWENGETFPVPYHRQHLCECLQMSPAELFPELPNKLLTTELAVIQPGDNSGAVVLSANEAAPVAQISLQDESVLATEKLRMERLEIQKKSFDYALSMANQLVDTVYPLLLPTERVPLVTGLLLDLLQEDHAVIMFLLRVGAESA